jgi:mannan endo-1,4-beta-mannosidase
MRRLVTRFGAAALAALAALWQADGPVHAQPYPTMASEPDPAAFVKRTDTGLTLLGNPMRFGGFDIDWLGLRRDGAAPPRRPTEYEMRDALRTVQALGGRVIRSRSLAGTVGCTLCLEPAQGHYNTEAFATLDLLLKMAGDMGLKVILPLAGGGADCNHDSEAAGDGGGSICTYVRWRGLAGPDAFFADPSIQATFLARVRTIVDHVNALTGVAYKDDPTILAWENCDACGAYADPGSVSSWVEAVGREIKSHDSHHLYENGAFAGRILPGGGHAVGADKFAPPSVDIVGDGTLPAGDSAFTRGALASVTAAVMKAGRVYVLDRVGWGPGLWKDEDGLQMFLTAVVRQRTLAGAVVDGLQGHADGGGYLPAPPSSVDGQWTALYFPGIQTADMSEADMQSRARALRRFEYNMADVTLIPAPLLPPNPEIVSVKHGHVVWRGAAGALDYSLERSADPSLPNSFVLVCDRCATDLSGGWQDPSMPAGPAWYRVIATNINGHKAKPSEPVKSQ